VVTLGRLSGLWSYEFEVVLVAAGARVGAGGLGICFVGGTPLTCMQYNVNAAVEGCAQYKAHEVLNLVESSISCACEVILHSFLCLSFQL
jgi:hypothetical protein